MAAKYDCIYNELKPYQKKVKVSIFSSNYRKIKKIGNLLKQGKVGQARDVAKTWSDNKSRLLLWNYIRMFEHRIDPKIKIKSYKSLSDDIEKLRKQVEELSND